MSKTALITGAGRGIGAGIATKLASEGWNVAICDLKPMEDGKAQCAELEKNYGIKADYFRCDISKTEDRQKLVDDVIATFGSLEALINNAGVAPKVRADLLEMSEESYDAVMNVNTKGTLFLTQAVANEMIANREENGVRGAICNISSMSAYTSSVNRGEYCISKAGVSMITKLFADRLATYGIPVNEVRPGIIATDMTAKVKDKYDTLIDGGLLPIARWGKPEDIACAVFALMSGALPYITGQSLDVDGGFHIRRL